MKKILLSFLCLLSASIGISYAQSIYKTQNSIKYLDIEYHIDYDPYRVVFENAGNTLLHQHIYKVGSNPREYYTIATGRTVGAEMDESVLVEIERNVFSGIEWDDYTENRGFIDVEMAVNPDNGRVLEVKFYLHEQDSDNILRVSVNQLHWIEQILKEKAVCHVSQEIKDAMPSYVSSGFFLFYKQGFEI